MAFFVKLGSFFGENLLVFAMWMLALDLLGFVLVAEAENRVAHKKGRFPTALLLLISILGGALGILLGHTIYYSGRRAALRGLLWSFLMLAWLSIIAFCVVAAEKSPLVYLADAKADLFGVVNFQKRLFSGYKKPILIVFAVFDLISLIAFGIDKLHAVKGGRRIPERLLLLSSLLCGALGSFFGMLIFRHKIRHPKFTVTVTALLILQIAFFFSLS